MTSLWGEEFDVLPEKEKTKSIIKKISEPKEVNTSVEKQLKSKKISIEDKMSLIEENVMKILGQHKEDTLTVKDNKTFSEYIDLCIRNKVVALDTETNNSLDPITCLLMGLCLYTPNGKQVYVPINHINRITQERLDWQCTEEDCRRELQRLIDNDVKIIFHNAKFDYEVIKCTCNIELPIHWDTMLGARLLDENEEAKLKVQYQLHIDSEHEKYSIEKLFEKEQYSIFDPDLFALYSATDAMMTYKLYMYQKKLFEREDNSKLYNLFKNVEVACIIPIAEMELNGVKLDLDYCNRLSSKYHKTLNEMQLNIVEELKKLKPQIDAWRKTADANKKESGKSKNEQLEENINLGSPTQLAILLYDVLQVPVVDKKKPRGTGKDELDKILEKTGLNICKLIIDYKKLSKLVEAFLDALPKAVNSKTGNVHCSYNQIGADTGRFSCSNPNLQQIPSHNKEIRMMFRAKDDYVLCGSDFSQQEPRLLSFYSQDENMINAYKQGKDLYSTIATSVYHNKYEDNLEHYEDGSLNAEGKKRRSSVKSLLLGIMYGMGPQSIADSIKSTKEEAQDIIDNFYKSFPSVKKWMDDSESFAKKNGYVEDFLGRRRRLPDITLQPYVVKYLDESKNSSNFNPFLVCKDRVKSDDTLEKYESKCEKIKYSKDYENIKSEALKEDIDVRANTNLIAQATRQCVNARIQGGAATMTKVAMIKIHNDEELKKLGFHLLIQVHDEVIGECPKENAEAVAERLTYIMKTAVADIVNVPFKCDAEIESRWYENEYNDLLKKEYKKCNDLNALMNNHSEVTEEYLRNLLQI